MPGRVRSRGASSRSALSVLALALAAVCLALLAGLGAPGSASASANVGITPAGTTPPAPTHTPTATPSATSTTTVTPTTTGTATPTATKAAPTATPTSGSGNGGGGGSGGDSGPQPTKVVFTQPNGSDGSGPLGGLSPSTIGSSGLLFAATGSCIVALLGLIVAAISLMVLVQGGYGPFLRALLPGWVTRRWARQGEPSPQRAGGEWAAGYGDEPEYDRYPPADWPSRRRHPYDDGYASGYEPGYQTGYGEAPARSQPVRRPPSSSRSRPDWR